MIDKATQKVFDLGVLKDRHWIKRIQAANSLQNFIALLRSYKVQTPDEEAIIQLLVDKFDPPRPSITKESNVRKEMEALEAKGMKIDTPKDEAMWQQRLDEAAAIDTAEQAAVTAAHIEEITRHFPNMDISMFLPSGPVDLKGKSTLKKEAEQGTKANPIVVATPQPEKTGEAVPTPLERLEGLPAAAQATLKAAGIQSVEDFFALTQKKAFEILNSEVLVARFAQRLKSDPGELL